MRKKTTLTLTLAAIAVGGALAGCGSSTSTAAGVALAPGTGSTQGAITTAPSTSTTSSTSTANVPTPTSGPLSKEPAVPAEKGAPPTKLETKDLITGTGAEAKSGSTVTVNYVGALYKNGKVFDASWKRKQTFTTPLTTGSVIPGWVEGIQGMKVGGRRVLIIPPSLGYGKTGSPPAIPGNATLVFVVDLLKVS